MKNILSIIFLFLLFFVISPNIHAQKSVKKIETAEFSVQGVCEMCEKRIEKAALISGVMSASWDKDLQKIIVIYKPKKASLDAIKQAIAQAGHDTDSIKAPDEAYGALPGCCAYRDGVKVH
jgi:Cu(I)/Ag(I) efflux system membrane fusion protein